MHCSHNKIDPSIANFCQKDMRQNLSNAFEQKQLFQLLIDLLNKKKKSMQQKILKSTVSAGSLMTNIVNWSNTHPVEIAII